MYHIGHATDRRTAISLRFLGEVDISSWQVSHLLRAIVNVSTTDDSRGETPLGTILSVLLCFHRMSNATLPNNALVRLNRSTPLEVRSPYKISSRGRSTKRVNMFVFRVRFVHSQDPGHAAVQTFAPLPICLRVKEFQLLLVGVSR